MIALLLMIKRVAKLRTIFKDTEKYVHSMIKQKNRQIGDFSCVYKNFLVPLHAFSMRARSRMCVRK